MPDPSDPRHPVALAHRHLVVLATGVAAFLTACSSSTTPAEPADAATRDGASSAPAIGDEGPSPADDAAKFDEDVTSPSDASGAFDAPPVPADGGVDGGEGGLAADRFVTGVVSFTPGPCAGFGESALPGIVEGPPKGGGATMGSLDVVSLGVGGEIVLSFAPNAIVDGPGPDFIVFENPFYIGGNPMKPYAEPGEVSVSDDGTTWATYPCTATSYPYGQCAGWHAVYSAPGNGISPVDPATAGGEAYDLSDVGLSHARYVRIRDKSGETCPDAGGSNEDGFDLDAISIVNAEIP